MTELSAQHTELRMISRPAMVEPLIYESPSEHITLAVPLHNGWTKIEKAGETIFDGKIEPGAMRLQPASERVTIKRQSASKALFVLISTEEYARFIDGLDSAAMRLCRDDMKPIVKRNRHVNAVAHALLHADAIGDGQRDLFIDGLAQALLAALLGAQSCNCDVQIVPVSDGLSKEQFCRCRDYAESRLEEGLDLHVWAKTLGIAASEFSRRFHATTGMAPYAWFLERRIERAQEMLLAGKDSLGRYRLGLGVFAARATLPRPLVSVSAWRPQAGERRTNAQDRDKPTNVKDRARSSG